MIDTERLNTLASVKLHAGNNGMEAPCIMDFAITINDASVFAAFRQELLPFSVRIAGTAGTPEQEQTHAFILADWAVKEVVPFAFETRGLSEQAEVLRRLAPITNRETARAAARATVAAYTYTADAAYAVAYAADAAARAAAAAYAAAAAAYAARAAAYAVAVAKDPRIVWDMCLEVLDKLIKVTE